MYGVSAQVDVKAVDYAKRILVEWGSANEKPTTVEWTFMAREGQQTLVEITNSGFNGDGDAVAAAAIDSMGGFSLVLAALKAFLEHGIALNVVVDHNPDAVVKAQA